MCKGLRNVVLEFRRGRSTINDSDADSYSQPFPPVPNVDSDLGSPYENVRPSSKNSRSFTTDTSPSTSPHRWDFQRYHRPPEGFDDRRVSGTSANSMLVSFNCFNAFFWFSYGAYFLFVLPQYARLSMNCMF